MHIFVCFCFVFLALLKLPRLFRSHIYTSRFKTRRRQSFYNISNKTNTNTSCAQFYFTFSNNKVRRPLLNPHNNKSTNMIYLCQYHTQILKTIKVRILIHVFKLSQCLPLKCCQFNLSCLFCVQQLHAPASTHSHCGFSINGF